MDKEKNTKAVSERNLTLMGKYVKPFAKKVLYSPSLHR